MKNRGWLQQALAQRGERGANFQQYTPPPQARCDVYKQQFDRKRAGLDSQDPQVNQAMKYRTLGEVYCNTGHAQSGQKVLRRALELIGQKSSPVQR